MMVVLGRELTDHAPGAEGAEDSPFVAWEFAEGGHRKRGGDAFRQEEKTTDSH